MTAPTPTPTEATATTSAGARELHVERILGRHVRDSDGRKVGRIEEMIAEVVGPEWLVTEVHLGPGALLERLVDISSLVPLLGKAAARSRRHYRVRWNQLDVSNPDRPCLLVRRAELERL